MPIDPKKLTQARERAGLTVTKAAQAAGMHTPSWYRIESGICDPAMSVE